MPNPGLRADHGRVTVEAMDENLDTLPESFGGMSGGGLWRVYFVEDEARIVSTSLCGIAPWQIDKTHIACQGWDRIDQALFPQSAKSFGVEPMAFPQNLIRAPFSVKVSSNNTMVLPSVISQ